MSPWSPLPKSHQVTLVRLMGWDLHQPLGSYDLAPFFRQSRWPHRRFQVTFQPVSNFALFCFISLTSIFFLFGELMWRLSFLLNSLLFFPPLSPNCSSIFSLKSTFILKHEGHSKHKQNYENVTKCEQDLCCQKPDKGLWASEAEVTHLTAHYLGLISLCFQTQLPDTGCSKWAGFKTTGFTPC